MIVYWLGTLFKASGAPPPVVVVQGDDVPWYDRFRSRQLEEIREEIEALETAAPAKRKKKAKALQRDIVLADVAGARAIRVALQRLAEGAGWHVTHLTVLKAWADDEWKRQERRRRNETALLMLI
jgi:hypothetical protein